MKLLAAGVLLALVCDASKSFPLRGLQRDQSQSLTLLKQSTALSHDEIGLAGTHGHKLAEEKKKTWKRLVLKGHKGSGHARRKEMQAEIQSPHPSVITNHTHLVLGFRALRYVGSETSSGEVAQIKVIRNGVCLNCGDVHMCTSDNTVDNPDFSVENVCLSSAKRPGSAHKFAWSHAHPINGTNHTMDIWITIPAGEDWGTGEVEELDIEIHTAFTSGDHGLNENYLQQVRSWAITAAYGNSWGAVAVPLVGNTSDFQQDEVVAGFTLMLPTGMDHVLTGGTEEYYRSELSFDLSMDANATAQEVEDAMELDVAREACEKTIAATLNVLNSSVTVLDIVVSMAGSSATLLQVDRTQAYEVTVSFKVTSRGLSLSRDLREDILSFAEDGSNSKSIFETSLPTYLEEAAGQAPDETLLASIADAANDGITVEQSQVKDVKAYDHDMSDITGRLVLPGDPEVFGTVVFEGRYSEVIGTGMHDRKGEFLANCSESIAPSLCMDVKPVDVGTGIEVEIGAANKTALYDAEKVFQDNHGENFTGFVALALKDE